MQDFTNKMSIKSALLLTERMLNTHLVLSPPKVYWNAVRFQTEKPTNTKKSKEKPGTKFWKVENSWKRHK